MAETPCNQLLIDTATKLLIINLPTLKSVAMSLSGEDSILFICESNRKGRGTILDCSMGPDI